MAVRVAVLVSGGGSNLQAIIDYLAARGDAASFQVELVASNRASAPALERARRAFIEAVSFDASDDGAALLELLRSRDVHLVVLAGYVKRLPRAVTAEFHRRIINVHPGLLPEFGGAGMYGARVHAAVIASGSRTTGVTVHFVDDEYDHGPRIADWRIPVLAGDTAESLAARVLEVEHVVLPRVLDMVAALNDREFFADY